MNLSCSAELVVFKVVVVPFTVKSPLITAFAETVSPANVGESPDCRPVSTSVCTPLTVALTVPCEGELKVEPETIPAAISIAMLFQIL